MSEHTKGPWDWRNRLDDTCAILAHDMPAREPEHCNGGFAIAHAFGKDRHGNARLMAAAPDLLAALELILSYDDMVVGADEARAAIAKARGEG